MGLPREELITVEPSITQLCLDFMYKFLSPPHSLGSFPLKGLPP
jgi:hypothetical protein